MLLHDYQPFAFFNIDERLKLANLAQNDLIGQLLPLISPKRLEIDPMLLHNSNINLCFLNKMHRVKSAESGPEPF